MNVEVSNSPTPAESPVKEENDSTQPLEVPHESEEKQVAAVDEEDEEVKVAMAMALAAAQNPKMSPQELRKLVENSGNKKQADIVASAQETKKQQQQEAARQRWENQKQNAVNWWKGTAQQVQDAAAHHTQVLKEQAERRRYADVIKKDPKYQELRKKQKVTKKTLKAHRLHGNRVETRHAFKRQRMGRHLIMLQEKLRKTQVLLTGGSFNVHEYAKAMIKASEKWHKEPSNDEELSLEAQLCQNMHQMLSIEKQKSKVKKETREVRKYLQRCKGWLDDKRALCEMNALTLDATSNSMTNLYQDILKRQDELIAKLREREEFAQVDLSDVDVSQFNIPPKSGPGATLNALRGLPFRDSVVVAKEHQEAAIAAVTKKSQTSRDSNQFKSRVQQKSGNPELIIETNEDHSVSSHLSDPDNSDGEQPFESDDAPWNNPNPNDQTNVEAAQVKAKEGHLTEMADSDKITDDKTRVETENPAEAENNSAAPAKPTERRSASSEGTEDSEDDTNGISRHPPKNPKVPSMRRSSRGSLSYSEHDDSMVASEIDPSLQSLDDDSAILGSTLPTNPMYMSQTERSSTDDSDRVNDGMSLPRRQKSSVPQYVQAEGLSGNNEEDTTS